jgi:hypothetical protein
MKLEAIHDIALKDFSGQKSNREASRLKSKKNLTSNI